MIYRFYKGPSGSGKSYTVKQDLVRMAAEHPDKNFLLIVPDQYTMQEQVDMVKASNHRGIINIDVLSFGRLAHKVFEETGQPSSVLLDDTGKNLILRRVSLNIADKLSFIGSSLNKPGYIHQVKSAISEFMQYGLLSDDLAKIIEMTEGKGALKSKLADLKLMYDGFQNYKKDHFITTEERLELLATAISRAESLKNAIVIFDGFTGFTPVQNSVLVALLYRCEEVRFSFCIDSEAEQSEYQEGELFALTKKSIASINRLYGQEMAEHREDIVMPDENRGIRFNNDELKALEKSLFKQNPSVYEGEARHISIFEADSPRDEVRALCLKIRELVEDKGMAYRDIAVVTGALDTYAPFFEEQFRIYDIPCFVDRNRHLELNPFTEFIKSGLSVIRQNFSYESVMNLLRSGMTGIETEQIDRFENYLIATKMRGIKAYKKDFTRLPRYLKHITVDGPEISEETREAVIGINNTRKQLMESLEPLLSLSSTESSVSEMAKAVYAFMEKNSVYEKLEDYKAYFREQSDAVREKEYAQVYRYFCGLLEQLDSLLGSEKLGMDEFYAILEAGISEIKIGVLPGETDYVLAGDIERSRLGHIKALFFAGVNDGIIPKLADGGGIISSLDREYLSGRGVELSPTPRNQMFFQRLYLYMNITKPTDYVYLSFSRTDSSGKALRPSYFVSAITGIFPNIEIEQCQYCHEDEEECLKLLKGSRSLSDIYSDLLRRYAGGGLDEKERDILFVMRGLINSGETDISRAYADRLIESAFYRYTSNNLEQAVVDEIYGRILKNSVSRIERFAACAYSHFLQYGLHLSERESFEISSLDMGNVYHSVLQKYIEYVIDKKLEWESISEEESIRIIDKLLEKEFEGYNDSIFRQDRRAEYQAEKMRKIIIRAVDTMSYQIRQTAFVPRHMEMKFDRAVSVRDVKAGLTDNERLKIQGKIDRIDTYTEGKQMYVKIVDYKSSDRAIDLIQFYNGLSLQLVVYLDQAVKKMKEMNPDMYVKPSALYYYALSEPLIESDTALDEDEINEQIRKKMRLDGFTVNDDQLIEKLGGLFDADSSVIKVKKTSKGYDSRSQLISSENLETMMDYSSLMLHQLGTRILEGDIKASPCGDNACRYCSFSDICGFDTRVQGYEEREAEKPDKDMLFPLMKKKIDEAD